MSHVPSPVYHDSRARGRFGSAIATLCALAVLLTSICVFVPFRPRMPDSSLDSSWMMAMNRAIADHIAIGRDLIFTFGPYSSIYSMQYSPSTDMLMLAGSAWLALCYLSVTLVVISRSWVLAVALVYVMASFMFTRDTLINSISLFYILSVLERDVRTDMPRSRLGRLFRDLPVVLGASALGLAVTVKVSFVPLAAVSWLGAIVIMAWRGRRWMALAVALLGPLTTAIAWLAAGQPVDAIPAYFINAVPISSGYTEAMSSPGPIRDILVFSAAAILAVCCGLFVTRSRKIEGLIFSAVLSLFLAVSFKGAFVRHDGHVLAAATAIVVAALALLALRRNAVTLVTAAAAGAALAVIDMGFMQSWQELLFNNTERTYVNAIDGISERRSGSIATLYSESLDDIRREVVLPILPGTSDLYFHSLAYLLVSGNRWAPRPIFQSYSAYSPVLIAKNVEHLEGVQAPDNIFLRAEAIDRRFPSMDDGSSWFALLGHYEPARISSDTLILSKKPADRVQALTPIRLDDVSATLNQTVHVPSRNGLIAVTLRFHRAALERLVSAAFKPPAMRIVSTLSDGSTRTNRLVPGMTSTNFLLSPYIENVNEFALLYGEPFKLGNKNVTSFVVSQDDEVGGVTPEFDMTFSSVPAPTAETDAAAYDPTVALAEPTDDASSPRGCIGSIDAINGVRPPDRSNVQGPLTLEGWVALDPAKGLLPDAVLIRLKGPDGALTAVSTHPHHRDDLSAFFKRDDMANAGFATFADTSKLHGVYDVTVALKVGAQTVDCSNLAATADFR